jgi:hypothetical protein
MFDLSWGILMIQSEGTHSLCLNQWVELSASERRRSGFEAQSRRNRYEPRQAEAREPLYAQLSLTGVPDGFPRSFNCLTRQEKSWVDSGSGRLPK